MAEQLKPAAFPFIGGSYESRSKTFDCTRTVNMFPELHDYGGGKGMQPGLLLSTPGLRKAQSLGTGPIRCLYTTSNAQLSFVVSGNSIYQITNAIGTPVTVLGNLLTSFGTVQMSDNGVDVIVIDGQFGYKFSLTGTPTLVQITDANFYNGSKTVTYLNGYFVLDEPGTSNFYFSNIDSATFPPLNEQSAATSPDDVIAVVANNQQLYLFGGRTFEVWADTGGSASAPFSSTGRSTNIGCVAPATIRKIAGTFFWLGGNEAGGGIVYSMENDTPTRVSTHAIEFYLQGLGDLSGTNAYTYQLDGHNFYVINLANGTTSFTYDMNTKQWHERQSLIDGVMTRHLGENTCFLNGDHIVGDFRNGNIYVYDNTYFYDDAYPLRRLRQTPHSSTNLANVFYKTLQVDIQPGTGTLVIDPRLVLRISRDGGFTWGNPIYAAMGLVGRYKTRARWQRLGYGRDLVFQVFCDDPVNVVFLSAFLDLEVGNA